MVPIEKVTSEVMSELISASLPAYDISNIVVVIFHLALPTNGVSSWTVGLVVPRGSPKYVNGMVAVVQPKIAAMDWQSSGEVLIGTTVDFWKLILRPMEVA